MDMVVLCLEKFGNIFWSLGIQSRQFVVGLAIALDSLRRVCPLLAWLYIDSVNWLIYSLKNYPRQDIFMGDLRQSFSAVAW